MLNKSRSRGQAIVMVTLGLMAMCGLMGLAVDVGWSMFVEKQAQASADLAALSAVQEAMSRLTVTSGFTCPVAPSGNTSAYCQPTAVTCSSLAGSTDNNLWNGCLYGVQNGFTDGNTAPVQKVTIQANDSTSLPPTAPGVNDVAYWVTVRTTQTVPQLFSAVLGFNNGVVASSATAAIVATVVPGSLYALNREGDCIATGNSRVGFDEYCGIDVRLQGSGGGNSPPCPGSGGANGTVCAGDGIVLASTCHGDSTQTGCSDPGGNGQGGGGNYAGQTGGSSQVWSRSAVVRQDGANTGAVNDPTKWTPTPVASSDPLKFRDPYEGVNDPPLVVPQGGGSGSAMGTCGIPGGQITNSGQSPLLLGPYQYYSYDIQTGQPDGLPIRLAGNIQFSSGGACSAGNLPTVQFSPGAAPPDASFPPYLFYGGLDMGNQTHFGPGQYVMVGVKTATTPALTVNGGNKTITGDTAIGTQFITTNPQNPYLAGQIQGGTPLATAASLANKQGFIEIKAGQSSSVQLTGIKKSALPAGVSALGDYDNNLMWQDRRNSTIRFNPDGTILDRPCANGCGTIPSSLSNQGVTEYSPEFVYDAAVQLQLDGVIYQPRGAWFAYQGNANIASALRVVTGMLHMTGGGQLSLLPTAAPVIRYTVALIH